MWHRKYVVLLTLVSSCSAISERYRGPERTSNEETSGEPDIFVNQKEPNNGNKAVNQGTNKGELLVAKFVETLMSSERYLKMIESVERKINHLDATFHERTNSILKYISELTRTMKTAPADLLQNAMRSVKQDLDQLKKAVWDRLDQRERPALRADGAEFHSDSTSERLSAIENQLKSVMAGVDSIVSTISEVKSRQYSRAFLKTDNINALDTVNLVNEFRKTLHDQKSRKCDCKQGRVDRSERYPTDCQEIQLQGFNVSGIYKIKPDDMEPFYVLCDLTTAGGGWTVFQNRFDGSQDFYKGWSDYKHGFGNLAGEFWLGLDKLNFLTNQKLYELRIEMETQHAQEAYASFSVFTVGPEHEGFRISTLGTYYGTAGDSLSYHAGQKFSTLDTDNDEWKDGACSTEHGGAWWYKECDKSNLNGKYSMSPDEHRGQSIYWISFKGPSFPLTKTKMMIRPLPASRPNDFSDQSRNILERGKENIQAAITKEVQDPRRTRTEDRPSYRFNPNQAYFSSYT